MDVARLYGPAFAPALARAPGSALVAEGLVGDRVRAAAARDDGPTEDEPEMKIVYTPISTLVPSLTPEQDAEILAAAGTDSVPVVAKTPDRQREEIVDANVLFGR